MARNSRSTPATTKRHGPRTAGPSSCLPASEREMRGELTMRRMSMAAVLVGAVLLAPWPASAASKEQQLLLAELRIMQQNQQQLAQSLIALAETLKTVTGRLDDQA